MRAPVIIAAVAVGCLGCPKADKGESCKKSAHCADKLACFAEKCVEFGSNHLVDITLVASDHTDLACAHDGDIAGFRCAHKYDQTLVHKGTAESDVNLLQPVTTKSNLNLLVAKLWHQPPLRDKLAKAKPDKPGARFTASCHVTVRGSVDKTRVRWKQGDGWHPATHVVVAVVDSCKISGR